MPSKFLTGQEATDFFTGPKLFTTDDALDVRLENSASEVGNDIIEELAILVLPASFFLFAMAARIFINIGKLYGSVLDMTRGRFFKGNVDRF